MAEWSFPWASVGGDRKYGIADWQAYFKSLITNGVFPMPSTGLQVVTANDGMKIFVRQGEGWIGGNHYRNEPDLLIQLDPADGVLKRIDRVVLRWDRLLRSTKIVIKQSAYASVPTAPSLQRDADRYELCLADVLVNNGAISISQAVIVDQRLDTALCGVVAGAIKTIDTAAFNAQLQAWFADYMELTAQDYQAFLDAMALYETSMQESFETWFNAVRGQLTEDAAGNIYTMVQDMAQTVEGLVDTVENMELTATRIELAPISGMTSANVQTGMQELFTFASDGKATVAGAIGAPAATGNTFAQLAGHVNDSKRDLAAVLTTIGVAASVNDSLRSLTDRFSFVAGKFGPYGDGSNGALDVTADTHWDGTPYAKTLLIRKFTTFRIRAGVLLTTNLPIAGLVIQATNEILIEGVLYMHARGQYVDIDANAIRNSMPSRNVTGTLFPIPTNGNGGNGGKGGDGTSVGAVGGYGGTGYGVAPTGTYASNGRGGDSPSRGHDNWSALPGGGGSGGRMDNYNGGGGGSIVAAGSGSTPGPGSTTTSWGGGCNITLIAPRIIINGQIQAQGLDGNSGGVGSLWFAAGGGSGGSGGGGVNIWYGDVYSAGPGAAIYVHGGNGGPGGVAADGGAKNGAAGTPGTAGIISVTKI